MGLPHPPAPLDTVSHLGAALFALSDGKDGDPMLSLTKEVKRKRPNPGTPLSTRLQRTELPVWMELLRKRRSRRLTPESGC